MLDLFELARLFGNWLMNKSQYTCEVFPRFYSKGNTKTIEVEIYRVAPDGTKDLASVVSASGLNEENLWDRIFNSMFAYFMEVGKGVE